MNVPSRQPADDDDAPRNDLESLLAAYDEALAQGAPEDNDARPRELRGEWAGLAECVSKLNRAARQGLLAAFDDLPRATAGSARRPAAGTDAALVGMTVGGFELVRELGRGGYGVVFLARDPAIERDVAIKVPRPEAIVTPQLRRRFLREARAAGRLNHPHLLAVHEVGEDGALCYLVAPYCRGPSLARWLSERTTLVAVRDAAQLVSRLASGLAHAHDQGVLHRDIKPANVLLDPPPPGGDATANPAALTLAEFVPKLCDFGLAKLFDLGEGDTRAGALLGTPAYMAPEQAAGRADPFTPASDLYSLGAILYEMLVGKPPLVGAGDAETLRLIAGTDPTPPRQIRPQVPRDLEAICLKCLEKDPHRRYGGAGELAADLDRFLNGRPTQARPLGMAQRTRRWLRRRPAAAALLAVSLAAIATILGGGGWYSWRLAGALDQAEQRRGEAVALRAEAERQRQRAAAERDANEQYLYASRIRLISQLIGRGDVEDAAGLLRRYDASTPLASLRGFEWHWLNQRLHHEWLTLSDHGGEVYAVAYAPDGKLVAAGGEDGQIRLWNATTGCEVRTFAAHGNCTNVLVFSPDGRRLASASCDHTVKLWNTADWSLERTFTDSTTEVIALALSPDGSTLAGGGREGAVLVWPVGGGEPVRLPVAGTSVDAVAFSPDGRLLAAALGTRRTYLWHTGNWQAADELPVASIAALFTPDSRQIVLTDQGSQALLCDVPSGQVRTRLAGHVGEVHAIAISPDGRLMATAGGKGAVILWNLDTIRAGSNVLGVEGVPVAGTKVMLAHEKRAQAIAFSPDSAALATAGFDGAVKIWDLANFDGSSHALKCPHWAQPPAAPSAAFSPDLARLTIASAAGKYTVWDLHARRPLGEHSLPGSQTTAIASGGQFVVGLTPNVSGLAIRDVSRPDGDTVAVPGAGSTERLTFSPSGRTMATVENRTRLRVRDVASGATRYETDSIRDGAAGRQSLGAVEGWLPALLSDARLAVLVGSRVQIVDLDSGRPATTTIDAIDTFAAAVPSADGSLLAVLHHSPNVSLIDTVSKRLLRVLHVGSPAHGGAFSADGHTLAVYGATGDISLWHVATGQELTALRTQPGTLVALRFSDDGLALAALVRPGSDSQGWLYLWSTRDESLARAAAPLRKPGTP